MSIYVYWFLVAETIGLCNSDALSSLCLSIYLGTYPSMYLPICQFYVQEAYKEMYQMEAPRETSETVGKPPLPVTETRVVS